MLVLIRNARVIDPSSDFHHTVVDILVNNGVIDAIDTRIEATADVEINGDDLMVSQGWVDLWADYREPGFEHKETLSTGLNAAATGGFTQVLLAPNTLPTISSKSVIQYILQQSADHIVQLLPMGAVSQNIEGKELAEMMDMRMQGAVAFTDGWKPLQNANLMLKALEYVKSFDGTIVQLPLDTALASGGLMHEGIMSTRLGMPGIPDLAETLIIYRDIALARYTQSRLHISGVSSAAGIELVRAAKAEGLMVTCSVTPYHLALNDESLSTYDSVYKVAPPIRTEADRQALIAALADGTIDGIASHHRPQEWDAKAKEFEYAADGMNVQEIAFPIIWQAVQGQVTIDRLIAALAHVPKTIFGLQGHTIAKGNTAEITIFTTSETTTPGERQIQSMSRNHPFGGKVLQGHVSGIINGNKTHVNKI